MADEDHADVGDGFDRVAAGWEKWTNVSSQRDPTRYFAAAAIGPGDQVLEIGAGTGDQTLPLAHQVGPDGRVIAADVSAGMIAVAQRRADQAGLSNIDFYVGTVSELGLESGSFDAVISGFTWLFLPDPVGEAGLVRSALKAGGRFAASVWGPVADVPMMALPMSTVLNGLGIDATGHLDAIPMPLSDPETFGNVWTEAGFVDVAVDAYRVDLTYKSASQFADWVFDIVMPVVDLIDEHAPGRRDDFHARIAKAGAEQARDNGTITLSNPAFMASGQRP